MNSTLKEILKSREDISEYVFHFTKHSNARDTLEKILDDKSIRDVNNTGRICFTEAPVTMLPSMFSIFERYQEPMYAPYGIGIRKEYLWKLGGRPVCYGDASEKEKFADIGIDWRFEPICPGGNDFAWLREWRINKPEVQITKDDSILITKTPLDREELANSLIDILVEAEPADGGFETFYTGRFDTVYRSVSIEEITDTIKMSKEELEKFLNEQGGEDFVPLGSGWQ